MFSACVAHPSPLCFTVNFNSMDTISRDNNSMLPVAGVIVGALGLLLGAYAAVSVSKVKSQLADDQPKIDKVDDVAAQASAAASTANSTKQQLDASIKNIQDAFNGVGNSIGQLNKQVADMQEAAKKAPVAKGKAGKGGGGEVVAGPGEYVVKSGDTSTKIARSVGCTSAELRAVNPGVNWSRLHPGQKLKVPEKKPAA